MTKPTALPTILVVPDSHARPEMNNDRFTALGNFIAEKKPDIIVNIGDMADMASLSTYDIGRVSAEGKRYVEDVEATRDAVSRIMSPVNAEIQRRITNRKKRWNPQFHITLGNHENRINRAASCTPSLYGHLSTKDLGYEEAGWKVHPFLVPFVYENIAFQHYFVSGGMGRPIGGANHARSLVVKNYMSSVCGHSHVRDYYEDVDAIGRRRFGLVAGCYDEGDHGYAQGSQHRWWSGLVMLHDVHDGHAEPAFFSTDYVKRNFL